MLDIVSASYGSAPYLNLNYELLRCKRPFRWIVIDNSPFPEQLNPNFEVHNGPQGRVPKNDNSVGNGSFYHGLALDESIGYLNMSNRFALFLDPDFFIIPSIDTILDYMMMNDLAFFGAAYSNTKKALIRNFPVAYCLFVDTSKVNVYEDSFTFAAGGLNIQEDIYPDVGWRIYKYYSHYPNEYVIPHLDESPFDDHKFTKGNLTKLYKVDVPKPTTEYFWKGQPFAIHTRMKVEKFNKENRKLRIDNQIKLAGNLIRTVRKCSQ